MIQSQHVPLDRLLPDSRNPKQHDPENIKRLVSRIQAVGFTSPVLVDEKTGILCAGHRRRLALHWLRENSFPEPDGIEPGWLVPARVGSWTELQALQVLVGDNEDPAEISFDQTNLTALLAELDQHGGLEGAGYDAARLDELIGELGGEYRGTGSGVDPNAEWDGMPEFDQPDATAYQTIKVHFCDDVAVAEFAALIGQDLTSQSKWIWHPEQKPLDLISQSWASEPAIPDLHHLEGALGEPADGEGPDADQSAVPHRRRAPGVSALRRGHPTEPDPHAAVL